MLFHQVMQALEQAGSEQTRKTYSRHGVTQPMFGVSFAEFKKLSKKIKINHALAIELWQTGNFDAQILATMIADPQQLEVELLNEWIQRIKQHTLAAQLAGLIAKSPLAQTMSETWIRSDQEYICQTGWNILNDLALSHNGLPNAYFETYLEQIKQIHQQANRVRYAMNNALIAIGVRHPELHTLAIEIAQAIGKVQVDQGQTACKTPDALAYMHKTLDKKGYVLE